MTKIKLYADNLALYNVKLIIKITVCNSNVEGIFFGVSVYELKILGVLTKNVSKSESFVVK